MWKTVREFPLYMVNEKGQVKSYRTNKPKILKGWDGAGGYMRVTLTNEQGRFNRVIHRLVAEAFLEDWNPELQVDHIDRYKINNNLSNLRMTTHLENMANRKFHKDRVADILFAVQPWEDPWEGVDNETILN